MFAKTSYYESLIIHSMTFFFSAFCFLFFYLFKIAFLQKAYHKWEVISSEILFIFFYFSEKSSSFSGTPSDLMR